MYVKQVKDISKFVVAGINYKKTDASIRGQFAINADQYNAVLELARDHGMDELFVLSTCNRTEIYGFADDPAHLIQLLCAQTAGSIDTFYRLAYIKQGTTALDHLYRVGGGLDSQILGDYEIVGQLKQAAKFSREAGFMGTFLERMVNSVLQASKAIKNQTALSGGTVSVSFAAIQYIREKVTDIGKKKILLLGVGKIGRNTCKNLVDYLPTRNITLINRSPEKAKELADELGLKYSYAENLDQEIASSDIILVATNSPEPTILQKQLLNKGNKIIIDLSIPYNVEEAVQHMPDITLVNVDELSHLKDETLKMREAEVPEALAIIRTHIMEFCEWHQMRQHVPVLRAVKSKLLEIHSSHIYLQYYSPSCSSALVNSPDTKIQKVINGMALKLRNKNERGCQYIEAINEFFGPASN